MALEKSLKKIHLAAIDIGSNAIRMVIAQKQNNKIKTVKKYRFPIRLGADVFQKGQISGKNLKLSARTFKKFKALSESYKTTSLRAVGTSALREAKNSKSFIELVWRKSKIQVEIIDGIEEARLIHLAVQSEVDLKNNKVLLVDIGGGSVELTISDKGMMSATQSFPFGTVRTLEILRKRNLQENQLGIVIAEFVDSIAHFMQTQLPDDRIDFAVGTGGNLETIGKLKPMLLNSSMNNMVTATELAKIISTVQKLSVKKRIEELNLRPDRADVILPAALLIQTILRQASIEKLLIPHVGLKDGLLLGL